jgi:hypothetical protein
VQQVLVTKLRQLDQGGGGGGGAHTGDSGLAATRASVVVLTAGIGSVVITAVIGLGTPGRRQLGREQRHTQGEPSRR